MFGSLMLYVPLLLSQTANEPEVSMVAPDEYAVSRFGEVVESYQSDQPDNPKEKLIRYRALLSLAEEKLKQLNTPSADRSLPATPLGIRRENLMKSLDAKIDHYRKKIADLEGLIKKRR